MTDLFEKSIQTLELPRVLERLAEQAVTEEGRERCLALRPLTDADDVQRALDETSAAVQMTALRGSPSLSGVKPVAASLQRAHMGGALNTRELLDIAAVLRAARSAKEYGEGEGDRNKTCIDHLFRSLTANRFLEEKITGSIVAEDEIADAASPELASIRRHIRATAARVRDILNKLRRICTEAFETQVEKLNSEYQQYKTMNKAEVMDKIYYEPCVKTFVELCDELRKTHGEEFDKFYSDARTKAVARVNSGESNFPSATVEMMEAVLDYSGIQYPLVLLGFAPPYYPPTHSNLVKGKEGYGTKAYEFAKKMSEDDFGQKLGYENFFMGISDLSYSAITSPFDYEKYSDNTPLWGDSYNMDFEAMEKIAIPGIIYGPIGVNYHQYSERVNKESLLKVMPETTKALIEYMWTL